MGISISVGNYIEPMPLKPKDRFSKLSLKLLKFQDHHLEPLSFLVFIKSPQSFQSYPIVLVEPLENEKRDTTELCPAAKDDSDEIIEQQISHCKLIEIIFRLYQIILYKINHYAIWIFVSPLIPKSSISELIYKCHIYQFNDLIPIQCVEPADIFNDISRKSGITLTQVFYHKYKLYYPGISTKENTEPDTKIMPQNHILRPKHPLTCCTTSNDIPQINKIRFNNNCDQITPQVFLGSEGTALDSSLLEKHKITHIIHICSVSDSTIDKFNHITYFTYELQDSVFASLNTNFWKCLQYLQETIQSGGIVLVQCRRGISRSPTLVAAYLMITYKMTFEGAYHLLKEKRPIVKINKGFKMQLQEQESKLIQMNGE